MESISIIAGHLFNAIFKSSIPSNPVNLQVEQLSPFLLDDGYLVVFRLISHLLEVAASMQVVVWISHNSLNHDVPGTIKSRI